MATALSELGLSPWKFPTVKTIVGAYQTNTKTPVQVDTAPVYYGVYFYPFNKPGVDPVFAVVGGREVIIARPSDTDPAGLEIIQHFVDELDDTELFCTACWTKDKATGAPLLAVGGQGRVVKVLNVQTGEIVRTFSGHGEEIMEIALYPLDQDIIVSTGGDASIRFWSLATEHRKQPCVLILAGEGHKETILCIAFHETGKYLLSGGMDHMVNLWVIPDFVHRPPSDNPLHVIYPHFATGMLHGNYVDCVAFHGDLILSKAADEKRILLWSIQNFSSRLASPPAAAAPTTHDNAATRSAWGGSYERLLQFSIPESTLFFMRFGLFTAPYKHPLLVMGNCHGKAYMWDLSMIEKYGKAARGAGARDSTPRGSTPRGGTPGGGHGVRIREDVIGDWEAEIKAHVTMDVPKVKTTLRDVAFSTDGEYMVMVGEGSVIVVCKRGG